MGFRNYYGKPLNSGSGSSSEYFDVRIPNYTNLFDGVYEKGKLLSNYGAGDVSDTSDLYWQTGLNFIPVVSGKYLYCQIPRNWAEDENGKYPQTQEFKATRIVWYKSNVATSASFISYTDTSTSAVLIPQGANFCRISLRASYDTMDDYFVGMADDNSQALLPWEKYYVKNSIISARIKNENLKAGDMPLYKGKRWVLFGDSLTDACGGHSWIESTSNNGGDGWKDTEEPVPWTGYFWATRIAREFNLVLDNRGKSGSNLCISKENYASVSGVYILDQFLAEIEAGAEKPEFITIAFGTNCYGGYEGKPTDTSETTLASYYGACRYFIEKLREKCAGVPFGFIIPPKVDWSSSVTKTEGVPKARQAIKEVCEEYGVPYLDMENKSGITTDMLPDGVHVFSKEAQNLYYHAMRGFLMTL